MQPSELNDVRSAYRQDIINQRQQELRSNAESFKTSLKHLDRNQLTDWDLETLRMIERLWRSLKYECVYLHAFEKGSEAKAGIRKWLEYYNAERPHSTHGILTPDEAYANKIETMRLAA